MYDGCGGCCRRQCSCILQSNPLSRVAIIRPYNPCISCKKTCWAFGTGAATRKAGGKCSGILHCF